MGEEFVLNSIRARFIRSEEVKYISHLDLMKVFERALRRSHIPIAYTEGFNPHPKMVFGLPLSVGVTSEAEYGDFELAEKLSVEEFVSRLNKQLPAGLRIIDAREKTERENIMASIRMASYNIYVCCSRAMGIKQMEAIIAALKSEPEIIVKKQTKRGIKDSDIKPMIHKLELGSGTGVPAGCQCNGNIYTVAALLDAGSKGNLKPELVAEVLKNASQEEIKLAGIHRTGLFIEKQKKIFEPFGEKLLIGSSKLRYEER